MVEETTVYCGSCGGVLSATARFCRSCGASQEGYTTQEVAPPPPFAAVPAPPVLAPQPPTPAPPPSPSTRAWAQERSAGNRIAAVLAVAGGIGMCFMVLYAIVYRPLHYDVSINFGEPLYFGDILTFCSGALALVLGVLALRRAPSRPGKVGAVLVLAGVPTLLLVVLWAFPETFNLDYYFSKPIYFGFVYFCQLGMAHIGSSYENGYLQVPLLASSAAVFVAGCLMAISRGRRAGTAPGTERPA